MKDCKRHSETSSDTPDSQTYKDRVVSCMKRDGYRFTGGNEYDASSYRREVGDKRVGREIR